MDQEFIKLLFSQGIVATLLFFALKWLNKDRDMIRVALTAEQKERIVILEGISIRRTEELTALHNEFSQYRIAMQADVSAIHERYGKEISALQTEIRALYKAMLDSKFCPMLEPEKHVIPSSSGS